MFFSRLRVSVGSVDPWFGSRAFGRHDSIWSRKHASRVGVRTAGPESDFHVTGVSGSQMFFSRLRVSVGSVDPWFGSRAFVRHDSIWSRKYASRLGSEPAGQIFFRTRYSCSVRRF